MQPLMRYGDAMQYGFALNKNAGIILLEADGDKWIKGDLRPESIEEVNRQGGYEAFRQTLVSLAAVAPLPKFEDKSVQESTEKSIRKPPIHPAIKKLAEKHNIDLSKVKGTGKNGAIKKVDVEALI